MYLLFNVKDIAALAKECQENKFDVIIVIDGRRGLGKSTLGYKLSGKISAGKKGKERFKPRRDICFTREDVCRKLATKIKGIIMADEMINVVYNRDFYNEEQKQLIKMLNMYRDSCNVLIACVPNFYDLDKQFRNLCKIRINVVRRGYAIIHTQNKSSYSNDPWEMALNEKIEKSWQMKRLKNPQYSKLTTYRGILKFGDLSPKSRIRYEAIKQSKRNVIFKYDLDEEDKNKKGMYANMADLLLQNKIDNEELSKLALINNIDYTKLKGRLNVELKARGEPRTVKQIFLGQRKLERLEKMKTRTATMTELIKVD